MKIPERKRTFKNVGIRSRIMLSSIVMVIVPIILIAIFSPFFFTSSASYFGLSSVTTNSFSAVNQIQWDYTLNLMSKKLTSGYNDNEKIESIKPYISSIERLGSNVLVENESNVLYQTKDKDVIVSTAKEITPYKDNDNIMYMSSKGLVIVDHIIAGNQTYCVTVVNQKYEMADSTAQFTPADILDYITGKTGLLILIVVLLYAASVLIIAAIASQSISKPIKELKKGAEEITKGNFDYQIEYKSKNEIGKTADAFNDMKTQLALSIEEQHIMEQSRREMIAGVAHDLRTPLTSVKGYVEGLLDGIANTPEKQERYLKTIHSSTLDMEKMLNDLLTFSMLDLGKIKLQRDNINISAFIEDFAEKAQSNYESSDFEVFYTNNCSKNTLVLVDTSRFLRVLENIVSNSYKYRKKNDKSKIEIILTEYEKSVIIEFKDNGIGVDENKLNNIFETFYRVDPARSNVRDGNGLGLSVCKQIVELHGGTIWATGKLGEGLEIHISMPKVILEEAPNEEDINS